MYKHRYTRTHKPVTLPISSMELNPEEFFVAELFHTNTKQEKQVFFEIRHGTSMYTFLTGCHALHFLTRCHALHTHTGTNDLRSKSFVPVCVANRLCLCACVTRSHAYAALCSCSSYFIESYHIAPYVCAFMGVQSNDVLNCLGLGFCVQSNDILNCCTQVLLFAKSLLHIARILQVS